MDVVVSDSTTIMTLLRIDRLDILHRLFGRVYLPPAVYEEIQHKVSLQTEGTVFAVEPIADMNLYKLLTRSLDA